MAAFLTPGRACSSALNPSAFRSRFVRSAVFDRLAEAASSVPWRVFPALSH